MEKSICVFLMVFIVFTRDVASYPTSVPSTPEVCKSMIPGHGSSPQSTSSPFRLELTQGKVGASENVQIVVTGNKAFKGYYVQARDSNGAPIGSFSPTATTGVHSCGAGRNNAAFHGVKGDKRKVQLNWISPSNFDGDVVFTATVVQEFDRFWTQIASAQLTVQT